MTTALLSAGDLAVLAAVLRTRPATRADLPRISHRSAAEISVALDRLVERGFLGLDGDRLVHLDPELVLAGIASELLERQRVEVEQHAELWELLPGLIADARVGALGAAPRPPAEIVHGPEGQWSLWMKLMSDAPPRRPIAVFSELPQLASVVIAGGDDLAQHRARLGFELRAVIRSAELSDPAAQAAIRGLQALGAELRSTPSLPSWFYADAGVLVALPLSWGESAPTSLVVLRDTAVVSAVAAYAEALWSAARPLPDAQPGWHPVLELLEQGLSDGAVADALGLSLRTVRRRVAEASIDLGADSRFALGAAWAELR